MRLFFPISLALLLVAGCSKPVHHIDHVDVEKLFTLMPAGFTGIDFTNRLHETRDFNVFTYRNYHNGGGVAIADFNNDGLADIYFTANQEPNRLYLTEGGFRFRDVTDDAGVGGRRAWTTGVSVADINGDGWLDIYVSAAGAVPPEERANELFINEGRTGTPRFREEAAAYGIADRGYSVQGAFFDYDVDGDLDLYVLNNSSRPVTSLGLRNIRHVRDPYGGDRLYRNDGGRFVDASEEAGIYGSEIAFGLDVTISDVDRDGLPDIYVSNDFFERDYLYVNRGDGTFSEELEGRMRQISLSSMGADAADLDGDGYPEIFVTDMLPAVDERLKMTSTFESWELYQVKVESGFHHQFMRNTLQRNNRDGSFSEVAAFAGVEATDWSWGTLMADFDLDGRREIFVTNGVFRDVTDQDFIEFLADEDNARAMSRPGVGIDFTELTARIPSHEISNYFFRADPGRSLAFENVAAEAGLDRPSFSNGTAYGDLDNDGDLDLVVNNVNQESFVYRNEADTLLTHGSIRIRLEGEPANRFGIGAAVTVQAGGRLNVVEQMPARGFQSSVDHVLVVGLGSADSASVSVRWPDGRISQPRLAPADVTVTIRQAEAVRNGGDRGSGGDDERTGIATHFRRISADASADLLMEDITSTSGLGYTHRENDFVDFQREPLLVKMLSREGPRAAIGDVDGDGLEDVYIGGAKESTGALLIQARDGSFTRRPTPAFDDDAISEDVGAAFFDVDGDGDLDLYVVSGGSEYSDLAPALLDRLYVNDGRGGFSKAADSLPARYQSGSVVRPLDFDHDGDIDLFVGGRLVPWRYGLPPRSSLLENDGRGRFTDVTENVAPELAEIGMVTDAVWADHDGDGWEDLVLVGDWMPITFFENDRGSLSRLEVKELDRSHGWWNSITPLDVDGDGRMDFVAGNLGLNSRLRASAERPLSMQVHDYDRNGFVDQIISYHDGRGRYPLVLRADLLSRFPYLAERFPTYASYAGRSFSEVFLPDEREGGLEFTAFQMASCIIRNDGNGGYSLHPLPDEAQLAPIHAAAVVDATGDGIGDLILAGNFSGFKPEIGSLDAGRGLVLAARGDGSYAQLSAAKSGLDLDGGVRDLQVLTLAGGGRALLVVRNDGPASLFRFR